MESGKRKDGPNGSDGNRGFKKSKGGSGGKWQTTSHKEKVEAHRGSFIEPGDAGIWATCARGQEGRATTELKSLLYQFAERFYGIVEDEEEKDDDDGDIDIEASIRKETAAAASKDKPKLFTSVRIDVVCVLFIRVQPPIDPVEFVHRICKEIASKPEVQLTRYINRLTPMKAIEKANEKGLTEVAKTVLREHFNLKTEETTKPANEEHIEDAAQSKKAAYSYAIRPSIRRNKELKRLPVIEQIASLIGDIHQVNLTKPDKVILVEIYQTVCGMSVVGDDWETLKRYNLSELYQPAAKLLDESKDEATQQEEKKDEASIITTAPDSAEAK